MIIIFCFSFSIYCVLFTFISHSAFIKCSIIYLRRMILFVVSISSSLDLKSKDPPNESLNIFLVQGTFSLFRPELNLYEDYLIF